jgi:hypothetical protein
MQSLTLKRVDFGDMQEGVDLNVGVPWRRAATIDLN